MQRSRCTCWPAAPKSGVRVQNLRLRQALEAHAEELVDVLTCCLFMMSG